MGNRLLKQEERCIKSEHNLSQIKRDILMHFTRQWSNQRACETNGALNFSEENKNLIYYHVTEASIKSNFRVPTFCKSLFVDLIKKKQITQINVFCNMFLTLGKQMQIKSSDWEQKYWAMA